MEALQKTNGEEIWGSYLQGTELFSFYLVKSWRLDSCLKLRTYLSVLLDGSQSAQHLAILSPLLPLRTEILNKFLRWCKSFYEKKRGGGGGGTFPNGDMQIRPVSRPQKQKAT